MAEEKKQPIKSTQLKFGKRTFFFDVHLASNNKKYLKITESRFVEEGQPHKRSSFLLFSEELKDFQGKITELETDLK